MAPRDESEGVAFAAVARTSRARPTAVALAAVTIVAVGLLARQIAPGSDSTGTVSVSAAPLRAVTQSAAPSRTSLTPTLTTVPDPTGLVLPDRDPYARPYSINPAVPARPGKTRLHPAGSDSVELAVTLP